MIASALSAARRNIQRVVFDSSGITITQSVDKAGSASHELVRCIICRSDHSGRSVRFILGESHPSSRAYEILVNGCFDQDSTEGYIQRKIQVLCSKDEAGDAAPHSRGTLPPNYSENIPRLACNIDRALVT